MLQTVWNPSTALSSLQSTLNTFFNDPIFTRPFRLTEDIYTTSGPRVDLIEHPEEYLVKLDVPGFDSQKFNISYHDNTLTVSGERHLEEREGLRYHRVEGFYGQFTRSFVLPIEVDADKITASYNDGVLTVRLPKAESSKPKKIKIKG